MVMTRPDIAYSVSFVSRYLHKPTKQLLLVVIGIIKYLSTTKNLSITYSNTNSTKKGTKQLILIDYTDSN